MKITPEYLVMASIIVYIAFFTHPPPLFIALMLKSPVGQGIALVLVLLTFMRNQPIGMLLGVAYLVSSYPVLEYLDATEQGPAKKQPTSAGVPTPQVKDMKELTELMKMIPGKGEKIPQGKGKDETKPPPETNQVKPSDTGKVTEKFSSF